MQIIYRNIEGGEVVFGQQPPFFITSKKGFGAVENEITTQKQYGLDGEFLVHQRSTSRNLEVDGEIQTHDSDDMLERRIQLNAVLNPKLAGTLLYQNNERTFEIDVLVLHAPILDEPSSNLSQKFSLEFKAIDPYWMDKSEQDRLIHLSSVSPKFKFPLQIIKNFIFSGISSGDITEIENKGDVVVGMTIELKISGTVTNPKVLNVITQEYFGFSGTYQAGTVLNIVTTRGKKEVTKMINDVVSNAMSERMKDSSFLQLQKGSNFFMVQADVGAENMVGSVSFSPLIVGV